MHRARHQHRPLSADRARAAHHALHPRGAGAHLGTRSASSPSRRWSRATSTSSRAWQSSGLAQVALSVTTLDRQIARVDGAARSDTGEASRRDPPAERGRHPDDGDGGADRPRAHRSPRSSAFSRPARGGRRPLGRLRAPAPAARDQRRCSASGSQTEFPDRADRVIQLMQSMHGGRDYTSEFGVRQRGTGPYAEQIGMRFRARDQASRLQRASRAAAHRPVPAPRARRATNAAFLRSFPGDVRAPALTSGSSRVNLPRHGESSPMPSSTATDVRVGGGGAAAARRPVAGVDEAGRGPLAGPVVAAAVILDPRAHSRRHRRFKGARRGGARGPLRAHPGDGRSSASASPTWSASTARTFCTPPCGRWRRRWPSSPQRRSSSAIDGNRAPEARLPIAHRSSRATRAACRSPPPRSSPRSRATG